SLRSSMAVLIGRRAWVVSRPPTAKYQRDTESRSSGGFVSTLVLSHHSVSVRIEERAAVDHPIPPAGTLRGQRPKPIQERGGRSAAAARRAILAGDSGRKRCRPG